MRSHRFPLFLITWLLIVVWFQSGDRFVDGSTGESRASLKGPVSAVMPVSSASDIYSTIRDQIESRRQNNGATGDLLPVVTLCYAQTVDGSMYGNFHLIASIVSNCLSLNDFYSL